MSRAKVSVDEAVEFSQSLGKAATGNYELMDFAIHTLRVPDALGQTTEEWVDSIGGYVRMNVASRREAVKSLSGEVSGEGKNRRYERSAAEVGRILGISEVTVKRDREAIEVLKTNGGAVPAQLPAPAEALKTPEEKKAAIRELIEAGKTNAEISVELGVGSSTVSKERAAWKKEAEEAAAATPHPSTTKKGNGKTQPSKRTASEAEAKLDGYLAAIEGHALGLISWWRKEGREAMADRLDWVDETVADTEERMVMVLRSVRGIDADADAALTQWMAEAEGKEAD